ncbi:MAG: DEAD/DEAH box helicase [Candidatus Dormibacteria bacterium]
MAEAGPGAAGSGSRLEGYAPLLRQLQARQPVIEATSILVEEALAVWTKPGFETIASLPRLRFEPFPYQLQAAQVALRRMRGRAILADEVGLGKTIEAALVLSELRLRGLARKVLILTPSGLVEQWQEELDRKFALPSLLIKGGAWEPTFWSGDDPVVIASLAAARRAPLKDAIVAESWDLVIVDEAHHLKNPQTASARLARQLQSRYLLLLTATPVENRLDDLFQLVSLVRPGHFGTPAAFRQRHAGLTGLESARNLSELQRRTREVMIRHRRSEVARMLPRRLAETLRITAGKAEADLYCLVAERVRRRGREGSPQEALALRAVLRAAGSSPAALHSALETVGWTDLAALAEGILGTEKVRVLLELLRRHGGREEKVVVFTGFRRTLEFLDSLLGAEGLSHSVYHGSLSHRQKEAAISRFERELPVLLTTEAGGEGRNLQFCHVMINFDLPWNPMRIEQRLGRIHRVGQEHEVLLSNLVSADTIEDRILRVLEARISLFELVVGELDMILGRVDDEFDFETSIYQAHIQSEHEADFQGRLEALGEQLALARSGYLESRRRTDALVGDQPS